LSEGVKEMETSKISVTWNLLKALIIFAIVSFAVSASAQTENTLITFTGTNGSGPYTGLIEDSHGDFFGATVNGGANGSGVVYGLGKNAHGKWTEVVLYQFGPSGSGDGADPLMDRLAMDSHGNLYGTTSGGGAYGGGTVFELSPAKPYWKETILHSFKSGNDANGSNPEGGVALGPDGVIYGTTNWGGNNGQCGTDGCGLVFALSKSKSGAWTETILRAFTGVPNGYQCNVIYDGENPYRMTPVLDSGGNIFGTTYQGGDGCGNYGIVWEISPTGGRKWAYSILYASIGFGPFENPVAGVALDSQGNLYATDSGGNVAEFVKEQGYSVQILYQANSNDAGDYDTVSFDKAGNLYWTSQSGFESQGDKGAVHELSPDGQGGWTYTTLYKFPTDPPISGDQPFAGVTIDTSGNLYGTCTTGGGTKYPYEDGTIWEITP
jgi:uncharacterized repeat protein (TIGR03803 family)